MYQQYNSNSSISITPILNNKRRSLEDFENNVSNTKYFIIYIIFIYILYCIKLISFKRTQEIHPRNADGNINQNKKCSSCEGTDHCRISSGLCTYNHSNEKVI
jgi:hypothetical protein